MPVIVGLGLAIAGTVGGFISQQRQADAQRQALAAQQQAEAERKKAMDLDAARRKRDIIRQSIAARSTALAVTTNQGASLGSGLPGAYGGISGRTNVNELGVNQNQEIGASVFAANNASSSAYRSAAAYGSSAALYGGLSSLGGAIVKNQETIDRVGTWFAGGTSRTGTTWDGSSYFGDGSQSSMGGGAGGAWGAA